MLSPRVHNVVSYSGAIVFFLMTLRRNSCTEGGRDVMIATCLWTLHFARRTLESAFLHRYSKPSVPLADSVGEFLYYWGFAVWIAWSLCRAESPLQGGSILVGSSRPAVQALARLFWATCEIGNWSCHRILARLRPNFAVNTKSSRELRRVPTGGLFTVLQVSHPHYLCEILGWLAFCGCCGMPVSALCFSGCGAVIMAAWARAKHEKDRKAWGKRLPSERRALLPFIM
jgi:very-long-chain enoyl-CoA reductase